MKKAVLCLWISLLIFALVIGCRVGITTEPANEPIEQPIEQPIVVTIEPVIETVETLTPTPTPTAVQITEPDYEIVLDENELIALAKMAWGEARGCSTMEIAATMWTVLNRVDTYGQSIVEVVTAPYQFYGYSASHPLDDSLYELAKDVITRWQMEKQGASEEEVGRVLPSNYLYFRGDGEHNYFSTEYDNFYHTWDWSYPNPYETEES